MDKYFNLCRICLQNEANIPIFQKLEETVNVLSKLCLCLQEKIEDIEGYPKNICVQCSSELDITFDFINKYQKSYRILVNGQLKIKEELIVSKDEQSDNDIISEAEIFYNDYCKVEIEPCDPVTTIKIKLPKRKKSVLRKKDQKTTVIASSILERAFSWDGESWSPNSTKLPNKPKVQPVNRQPLMKLKRPKKEKVANEKNKEKLCSLCGEVLKNADRLSSHMKRKHFPEKLQCSQCPKICHTKHDLARHTKWKHSTEKNFVCSTCGKRFVFRNSLNMHTLKAHSKDYIKKLFNCSYCSKSYSCQKSVTIHERSVHTGLRPAVCSVCDSAFFHEEYLKEHMRLHTGETPFKCPICNRGYAQRGNMKSHIRIHRISEVDSDTLSKIKPSLIKLMKE